MIVRRAMKTNTIVAGAGAIEMELSRHIREFSRSIAGKQQLVINSYARALETIPRSLSSNAGLDSTDILNKLRQMHASPKSENRWFGVDCINGGVCDAYENFIWEPALVKQNALCSATEAACMILSVDETIRNPKSQQDERERGGVGRMARGRGRGRR